MNSGNAVEIFLNEARDLLEQLEAALLDLEARPDDAELINTTFRALHTLKGSGGMFGPPDMAAFAHKLEDAFERVRRGEAPLTPALVGVLLAATDQIRRLLFEPAPALAARSAELVEALQAAVGGAASVAPAAAPAASRFVITLRLPANALLFGTNPLALLDELRALGEAEVEALTDAVPELALLAPTELHLAWRITLSTDKGLGAIEDVFIFVDEPGAVTIEALGTAEAAPAAASASAEPVVAAAPAAAAKVEPARAEAKSQAQPEASVRVSASRLDTLLDQVGELVIAQARLTALTHQRHDPVLTAVVEEIERISADLRDSAMDMRMLPIDSLFSRYRRVVRDLSSDLGKEIDLVLSGEDTELDKTVLDRLGDPLVHIIRNSIDHGIEMQDRRLAAGKSKRGTLRLSARQSGTEVIITIEDDGAGLNRERILVKARAAGIVADGVTPPNREIDELIFHPGLSTAAAVSNLSGRGVGMDVVRRTIGELHGSIEIATEPGQGTRFTLRLPLTLAIIDGLLVRVGETKCILPLANVEECVELSAIECRTSSGRNFVDIRNTIVPIFHMDAILGAASAEDGIVVVADTDTGRVGVVVDQVVVQHQTVIKPLSPLHRATPGLAGATILGDGSVALILDINTLVRQAGAVRADRLAA
ncbi:chemotaxis protein CheA [Aureimonas phyllosphaerae]|uniref:Chemotaxis protein CheA n=1 Tax=Aureimonas phyllosphaerae TaxID=1166078 RepID=A0A7W6FUM4_9HYPH|nr:chemotaxis protein CheA [Aureimonas phyllosphaerae]MBB3936241.1 two-component system chemotaxis sensor kinase CheA [Aureimonas phyllosphaerae]MBB3960034.1 two-component system chemotaxis sensor kinase CheA [Aureimonas phyllosphaerae]SFF32532.1 two-component system, chemotaxis family, sensor kinase CheA [Aureimonas phyllosphaerae]